MMRIAFALLASYVVGSIPWAYLAGRVVKGIDLRQHGSGNLGATNVMRTLGAPWAVLVFALDAAKGAAPVLWLPAFAGPAAPALLPAACGVAAIAGHVRPVFLLWKGGGKGVATAAGAFAALAPVPLVLAFGLFVLVLVATRYMSLASLAGAVALPLAVAATRGARDPLLVITVAVGAFVFWTHRSNIGRLRRGVEPRLGQKRAV